jgi:nanoRNase/pAp phosphatase (c-di-AMP/oligoRNAs hydrolase)
MRSISKSQDFFTLIKGIKNSILLAVHPQADPDAVGSTIALIYLIRFLNPSIDVALFNPNFSNLSERMLQFLNYDLPTRSNLENVDLLILLDIAAIEEDLSPLQEKVVVIDHHIIQKIPFSPVFDFRKEEATSTAEIVTSLLKESKAPLNSLVVKSLLAGFIFDTRRFLYADNEVFSCLHYLLKDYPSSYPEILPLFTESRTVAERIARIKSAQRMKRFEVEKIQILISHVSSFEAAGARALVQLGGDIAFVLANRDEGSRISIRTSSEFIRTRNISVGKDIIPALISHFGGSGGGHDGAAGYNNPNKIQLKELQSFVLNFIRKKLTETKINKKT